MLQGLVIEQRMHVVSGGYESEECWNAAVGEVGSHAAQ